MCEYCDFDNEECYKAGNVETKELYGYGYWTSLKFAHNITSNKTIITAVSEKDDVSLLIHYCPICGRKLD